MSVEVSNGSVTVTKVEQRRTTNVAIRTPFGADPQIIIDRQLLRTDNGVVVKEDQRPSVTRQVSVVQNETKTIGGKTLSVTEIAEFIKAFADTWEQEDIDAQA